MPTKKKTHGGRRKNAGRKRLTKLGTVGLGVTVSREADKWVRREARRQKRSISSLVTELITERMNNGA